MIGFGKYGKTAQDATITTLDDYRLVTINPQEENFFNNVLNLKTKDKKIKDFIEAVEEVRDEKLMTFYRVIYDPSDEIEDNLIVFKKGKKPALGHSYNWWVELVAKMPSVEGKCWHIASEYQYYAFLVWLINQLVYSGKSVNEALNQIVNDSKELGNYRNSRELNTDTEIEPTGSRYICGMYDLANTHKFLSCSNLKYNGFWIGSGFYLDNSYNCPIANLEHNTFSDIDNDGCVGLLVLY